MARDISYLLEPKGLPKLERKRDISYLLEPEEKPPIPEFRLPSKITPDPAFRFIKPPDIPEIKKKVYRLEEPERFVKKALPSLNWLDKIGEVKKDPIRLVPFVASGKEMYKVGKLLKTAKDINEGKEVSKRNLELLKEYLDRAERDTTWGYKVANIVTDMIPFMGEFLATGGVYKVGQKAGVEAAKLALQKMTKKPVEELLEKKAVNLATRVAGGIAGATARTIPMGVTRIPAGTIEKQLEGTLVGDEEPIWKSLVKATGEQWVEVVSEQSGGLFKALTPDVRGALVKRGILRAFQKANPTKRVEDIRRIINRLGYHGTINEMLEERVADVGHGILEPLGLGDQKFSIPSLEQLGIELVAFSIPGVAFKTIEAIRREKPIIKPPPKEEVKEEVKEEKLEQQKELRELERKEEEKWRQQEAEKKVEERIEEVKPQEIEKAKLLPKELEPLAVEARKYKSAEEFDRAYPKLFDRLQEKGIITDSYATGQAMIRTFGPGKSGIINFYNQVVKGVREVKPPEPITIKNLLKSGKKEITEEEFRQLSKVKKGKRIAEDMRAYLEMKGIKVIEKEKAPPPIPEISPQLQNLIMVEGEGRTQSQKKFIVNKLLLAREKLIRQYLSRSPFFKDIDASQIPFLSSQEAKALDKMYTETEASLKNFNIQKKKLYKLGLIKNISTTDKEEWVRTPLGEASNSVNDVRMKELIKGKGVIEIRPTPTSVYKINNDLKAVDTMLERLRVKTRKDPILVAGKQEELPIETLRELLKTESGRLYVGNYLADRVREKTPEQQYKDITLEWYGKAMTREEARPTLSSAEFVKVVHEAQRRAIVSQNRWTFRKLWDAYRIRLVDVNTIAKDLLNTLGRAGVEPIMRRVVMAGATAEAHRKIENANHLIYKDLKLEPLFDEFIQMKRTIELYRIKEKNLEEFTEAKEKEKEVGIIRPYTKEEARHGLNAFYREQPKEVIVEIERMADEYYKVWHDILLAKRDKGLISNELLEKLEEQIHYSPSLFLHYVDPIAVYEVGERTITEPKSGVERLGEGSTELLYNKTRALLERGLVVAENLIARNDAQLSLLEIAETNPKNGFIKKGEEEKPPVGWSRFHAIRDGEKIAIDLRNDFAKSWIALPGSELQPALAKWIGYISLAKVVRPFATGPLAPFFFVTNFFRDIHRAAWVIKSYSPHSPIAIAQLSRDLAETYKDARDKKGAWIDYLKEYGGMQFLSMQGKIEKIGKWGEFLSYMNTLTESWVRLAIRNREIKSGKTPKEATFIARNQLDFAQGGGFAKAIDHGSPYFNVAIQGTRGVLNVIKGDPVRVMIMLSWLGVFVVGLDLANEMINPEGWDDIDDHIKTSHFIITTPIYFRNRKGEKQYVYFKFSKDQGQRFFGAIFQAISEKIRHDKNPLPTVVEGLKQTTPITPETPTNVPLIRALSGMWANYDFWRNRKIWDGLQVEARAEKDERTKQLYLDIAKATGLSPKRLEYFVEAIIGRDIFSSMIGNNYKMITQFLPDETKEDVNKHLLERLVHTPGIRRILGASTPGKKEQNIVNQIMIKKNTIRYIQQFEIDKLMRVGKEREARIFAIKETALPPDEEARERLNNYIDNWHKFRDIPFYWRGIRFLPPEDRVVALKKIIEEAETDREKKEIYDILGKRGYELGIIDKAGKFIEEWKRQFTIM